MEKPQMKRKVGISEVNPTNRIIDLWTDEETAKDFSSFGDLFEKGRNYYSLRVDARYEFHEVLIYIREVNFE